MLALPVLNSMISDTAFECTSVDFSISAFNEGIESLHVMIWEFQ